MRIKVPNPHNEKDAIKEKLLFLQKDGRKRTMVIKIVTLKGLLNVRQHGRHFRKLSLGVAIFMFFPESQILLPALPLNYSSKCILRHSSRRETGV